MSRVKLLNRGQVLCEEIDRLEGFLIKESFDLPGLQRRSAFYFQQYWMIRRSLNASLSSKFEYDLAGDVESLKKNHHYTAELMSDLETLEKRASKVDAQLKKIHVKIKELRDKIDVKINALSDVVEKLKSFEDGESDLQKDDKKGKI